LGFETKNVTNIIKVNNKNNISPVSKNTTKVNKDGPSNSANFIINALFFPLLCTIVR